MEILTFLTEPRVSLAWLMPLVTAVCCYIAATRMTRGIKQFTYGALGVLLLVVGLWNIWATITGSLNASSMPLLIAFGALLGLLGLMQFAIKRVNTWFWSLMQVGSGLVLIGSGLWLEAYYGISNTGDMARILMTWGLWILVGTLVVVGSIRLFKKLRAKGQSLRESKKDDKHKPKHSTRSRHKK